MSYSSKCCPLFRAVYFWSLTVIWSGRSRSWMRCTTRSNTSSLSITALDTLWQHHSYCSSYTRVWPTPVLFHNLLQNDIFEKVMHPILSKLFYSQLSVSTLFIIYWVFIIHYLVFEFNYQYFNLLSFHLNKYHINECGDRRVQGQFTFCNS